MFDEFHPNQRFRRRLNHLTWHRGGRYNIYACDSIWMKFLLGYLRTYFQASHHGPLHIHQHLQIDSIAQDRLL